MRLIFLIFPLSACLGFTPLSFRPSSSRVALSLSPPSFLALTSHNDDDQSRRQSRLEGMQRRPTPTDIAVIDDMITKLGNAKPYELPAAVAPAIRVVSSPQFFLRIAERADASDPQERAKLGALADNLVNTIQAVVSMAEDGMADRQRDVEKVVKAASEPDSGEFLVPLTDDRVDAMRSELEGLEPEDLNEGFLSTIDAWVNKASQDGMDGMVIILQRVLQIYAGTAISRARIRLQANVGAALVGEDQAVVDAIVKKGGESATSALLDRLLHVDTDKWNDEIKNGMKESEVTKDALIGEVQKTMEGVILGLENGSMSQRVQAEFLRELVTRIEAV